MTAPYVATLNPEQRLAVEYGTEIPSPLLIIAGAGSGMRRHGASILSARNAFPMKRCSQVCDDF
jgi:hypothetical protein